MSCASQDALRDYALNELSGEERRQVEAHLGACEACAEELQGLRLTTAALRVLPDVEIPRRIAFVSDKVFEPSRVARFFGSVWKSAAQLGFASACLLAGAIVFSAVHRPVVEGRNLPSVSIDEAVQKAVAQVRAEDARNTDLALAKVERKYDEKQRALMISVQENFEVMQKRLSSYTLLASTDAMRTGGQ